MEYVKGELFLLMQILTALIWYRLGKEKTIWKILRCQERDGHVHFKTGRNGTIDIVEGGAK